MAADTQRPRLISARRFSAAISRLRDLTRGGDYACYVDIAHFMADMPLNRASAAHWLDGEQQTRSRWRSLVTARQAYLDARH
ncbi:hypothetical protein ACIPRL_35620 [Streptomyces sp. NPDC090085]|uniref:hypothetical protein n=1 Tax=Streptomyces sp. NPDC090085 TaxID=3365943 RepID=UPI0038276A78